MRLANVNIEISGAVDLIFTLRIIMIMLTLDTKSVMNENLSFNVSVFY